MKQIRTFFICLIVLGLSSHLLTAQNRPAHELHSMMIYNFLKYIQWPGDQTTGEFVIGVVGDDNVYKTLNEWYGSKTRGDKKFIIKKFTSADGIIDCQLVYIGKAASGEFDQINAKIQNSPILTVTDKNGLGKKGSCINFRVVDNRLKFELNQSAIKKTKLKISSQLTSMAILI